MRALAAATLSVVLSATLTPGASWSLFSPPTSLPSWSSQSEMCGTTGTARSRQFWGAQFLNRGSQSRPTMRSAGNNESRGSRGATSGEWGAGATSSLSAWAAGAYRSALHASPLQGLGGWGEGGGSGGGNNGTGSGVPGGDEIEGGGGGQGTVDVNAHVMDGAKSRADYGAVPPKCSAFVPWVWLSALWGLYAVWLKRSPMLTKALTSGVLALGGDTAAQCFEFQQKRGGGAFSPDTRRLLAVGVDSVFITGPALHTLYGLLEHVMPTNSGGFLPAVCHLLVDTFVFDPLFVASFFCTTGILESRSLRRDVVPALRREFWPAVRGSWVVSLAFCPLQYATFRYLPLEFRVLSVNVCDIVWTSVLSYFSHKAAPVAESGRDVNKGGNKGGRGSKRTEVMRGTGADKRLASRHRKDKRLVGARATS